MNAQTRPTATTGMTVMMMMTTMALLVLAGLGAPTAAADPDEPAELAPVWRGQVHLPSGPRDPRAYRVPEPRVIRTQEAYEAFVAMIPTLQVTKQNPPPPSTDPLLQKPEIDFGTKMLIVAFRGENMYVEARISKVEQRDGKLVVTIVYPPVGHTAMLASAYGVGRYHAVLVDKFDGEIVFETIREPEPRRNGGHFHNDADGDDDDDDDDENNGNDD